MTRTLQLLPLSQPELGLPQAAPKYICPGMGGPGSDMLLDMTCVGIHAEGGYSQPLLCPHAANLKTVARLRFGGPYEATGGPRFHCLFVETEGSDFDLTSHTKERPAREIKLLCKPASGRGFEACPATDVKPFIEHHSFWEVNAVLEQQHSSLYQWIHKISCIRHMFQFPVQIANHAARSILHARIDCVFLIASGISGSRVRPAESL